MVHRPRGLRDASDPCSVCARDLPRLVIGRIASRNVRWVCSLECKEAMCAIVAIEGLVVFRGLSHPPPGTVSVIVCDAFLGWGTDMYPKYGPVVD